MEPVAALTAIVTATSMAVFAGDIPGTMPGTPASAAYTEDSYAMARKGRLNLNFGTNLAVSVVGGLVGVAALILAATALAEWDLLAGIDLIPAMIGLFAISEIMRGAIPCSVSTRTCRPPPAASVPVRGTSSSAAGHRSP